MRNGTVRKVAAGAAAVVAGLAIGAAAAVGSHVIGTDHAPPVARHAVTVTHRAPVTTSTTMPATYHGFVAVTFADAAACAQGSDDCWIQADGTTAGNVSARLMVDWITCAQSHAHDGRAVECHPERDTDGTRSIYGPSVGPTVAP